MRTSAPMRTDPGRGSSETVARTLLAGLLLAATPAVSAEGGGCERFAFDVTRERALLADAARTVVPPGATLAGTPPLAVTLALGPQGSVTLPAPSERYRRGGAGYAGHVSIAIKEPGLYRIALSEEGWIDAVQDGAHKAAGAFSGVRGCPGLRKVVKFELQPGPLLVEVSGAAGATVSLAVTPDR